MTVSSIAENPIQLTPSQLTEVFIEKLCQLIPLLNRDTLPDGFLPTFKTFMESGFFLDRERINILLTYWELPPMSVDFYNHYFPSQIQSIENLEIGIKQFVKDALWHYGDLKLAYVTLIESESIDVDFKSHSFDEEEFRKRLPWKLIKHIQPEDRGLLGYVSGEKPFRQKAVLSNVEEIIKELEDNAKEYENLNTAEISDKILQKLKSKMPNIEKSLSEISEITALRTLDLFSSPKLEENKKTIEATKKEIERTIEKVKACKEVGKYNQEQYLRNIEMIDVYIATSMRDDKEYLEMVDFVSKAFTDEKVKELNIRYFDPTLCYCESRIDKGIIECLLVRTSKITIYCAQEGDTFGKDSELAATLVQGKPVIVFVPKGQTQDEIDKLNKRASIFKDFHPLGLQVGLYDGVARGVIVVRSAEECAQVLYNLLTNQLEAEVKFEEHGIVLREKITDSVLRVMTGWGVLSNAFWNNFQKTQSPKTGNCI